MESENSMKTLKQNQSMYVHCTRTVCIWVIFRHIFRGSNDEKIEKNQSTYNFMHTYKKGHIERLSVCELATLHICYHNMHIKDFKKFKFTTSCTICSGFAEYRFLTTTTVMNIFKVMN